MQSAPMRPAPDVVSRKVGEELVLLDLQRGVYFGLDEVGARIWALMLDDADASTIVARLADEYEAPRQELEDGVNQLLLELQSQGLLVG